jgi:23S rRNA maturation mini-RNase III
MNQIEIKFSKDEAVVLFEFLTRFAEESNLQIEDNAEARVLWNLQSKLEEILVEPFQENYEEIVKEARNNLRDKE